jgi:uncharacterized PurR-regulated membrane protein YhhQ (DUF165 family)
MAVYTPLEDRSFTGAVVLSNTVGAVVDSVLFLSLAFGSLEFLRGQVVGKMWMTAAALPVVLLLRTVGNNPSTPASRGVEGGDAK